jgi:hypothetical protein
MPKVPKLLEEALCEAGAVLVRQRKHYIYRLPSGRIVSVPRSPSDWRTVRNKISELRNPRIGEPR